MASIPSESSVGRHVAHVLSPPRERQKWPVCLEAQDGSLSAHSCLTKLLAPVDRAAALGSLILPALPHLLGHEHLGITL